MPLTTIREIKVPGNLEGFRGVILAAAVGDAGDIAIGLNPGKKYHIHVTKPISGGEVFVTNSTHKLDGSRIKTLDDPDIMWRSIDSGVDEVFTGDEKGISGVKIESALDPTGTDINFSVIQTK